MTCFCWRWEAVLVYMVGLREEICSVRRAVTSSPQPHRRETLHVPRVLSPVCPQRSPREALSSARDVPWHRQHAADAAFLQFSRSGVNSVTILLSLRRSTDVQLLRYVLVYFMSVLFLRLYSVSAYLNGCSFWLYIQVIFQCARSTNCLTWCTVKCNHEFVIYSKKLTANQSRVRS